jgi:hypothetical protein
MLRPLAWMRSLNDLFQGETEHISILSETQKLIFRRRVNTKSSVAARERKLANQVEFNAAQLTRPDRY